MFATDDVAESAEYEGTEGTNEEAGGEGSEGREKGGGGVGFGEELGSENGGQTTKDVEVIPFDEGTQAGGTDDFPDSFFLHVIVATRIKFNLRHLQETTKLHQWMIRFEKFSLFVRTKSLHQRRTMFDRGEGICA